MSPPKHTENTPITAVRKVCLSVSRRCLSRSIEQGNLWEKEIPISQLVLVSRETRTVLTASFLKSPKLRKWSIEQGNQWEKVAQTHRLGPCLMNRDKMIIAEYCEKIGHHELQAARAEEERRILQEELWRQQKDFREVHQQSLTEMEELRKFQSSTFDTLARRKLIEDQNTNRELSGRLQELQNEVNCMNDSKDFHNQTLQREEDGAIEFYKIKFYLRNHHSQIQHWSDDRWKAFLAAGGGSNR